MDSVSAWCAAGTASRDPRFVYESMAESVRTNSVAAESAFAESPLTRASGDKPDVDREPAILGEGASGLLSGGCTLPTILPLGEEAHPTLRSGSTFGRRGWSGHMPRVSYTCLSARSSSGTDLNTS